ncbi:MAG: methylmalonyl-CoA mutase [Acidobacteria bacterium]|nr:methylmalonyl-CoA mutase [Acidobacteriota bacterium]MBU4495909.1 methylmalonyl-CoA mutase [Acidobacteriota bacterium]
MSQQKERKNNFATSSKINIKSLYTPEDLNAFSSDVQLGKPGFFPFTRGVYPTMYRGRLWTMRQYAGFGTAEESNRRYRYLLSKGQTGLSVAFDLPTQIGLDSDHPLSCGEVGKVGVAVDTMEDMDILFDGIPLDRVSVSMTINSTAIILLAMYLAIAEKRGIPWTSLNGTIQNDILKEYIARGTYIYPPQPSLRIITDILAFCRVNVPNWNTMSISGYHIREAGATAVQELAFTFADAAAYVEAAVQAGLEVDYFAPQLSFFLAAHNDLLEEIAKFRAARRIWARLMRERFQAKDPRSWMFRFHTQTSGATLQAQEPENNVIRVTLQALAATLGGTQSLHTNSRDEALSLPSRESARIALRTQQVIAHESGITDTVDPLGGSYYLESLTDRIEEDVNRYLQKIEDLGGMLKAIESGYIQREIQDSAYSYQKAIESRERIIVGLNDFTGSEEPLSFDLEFPGETVEQNQVDRLRIVKNRRSSKDVQAGLAAVRKAALSGSNLFPAVLQAVRAFATMGEITTVLTAIFGEYKESVTI